MTPTVSPLRAYVCADCGKPLVREPGGVRYRHAVRPEDDHAPRPVANR